MTQIVGMPQTATHPALAAVTSAMEETEQVRREVIVSRVSTKLVLMQYRLPAGTFTHFGVYQVKPGQKAEEARRRYFWNLGLLSGTPIRRLGDAPDPETGGLITFYQLVPTDYLKAFQQKKAPGAKMNLCLNAFFRADGYHSAKQLTEATEKVRFLNETYESLRAD